MADKVWKAFERSVSKYFGTTRNPLSGGNGKQTRSDSLHDRLFIECKYSKRSPIADLYKETEQKATKEGKVPIVCLKKKGMDGFLIVVHSKAYSSLKSL